VGSGRAMSSWIVMQWPGVARAAGVLGSVSSPRYEEEDRGRLGRRMGRWLDWCWAMRLVAGPPGGLAGWAEPVGWLIFGPLSNRNLKFLFFFKYFYNLQTNLNSIEI
jgi:hypothetical protein